MRRADADRLTTTERGLGPSDLSGTPGPSKLSGSPEPVCIVGAGPAGLAAARALREHGVPYHQFEQHDRVGGIWDIDRPGGPMYESARFISSKTLSAFTGFAMPSDYPDYPDHRQILAYCEAFAHAEGLHDRIEFGTTVDRVEPADGGGWLVTTSPAAGAGPAAQTRYRAVICASGAQWQPRIPDSLRSFAGEVIPARDYREPERFAGKRVLIVGAGNSGCDIAADIGPVAAGCAISVRRGYWFVPKYIGGVPSDTLDAGTEWLPRRLRRALSELTLRVVVGDLRKYGLQRPDHHVQDSHPIIGTRVLQALGRGEVVARPDIARITGRTVEFTDGVRDTFDALIAATGYAPSVPYAEELISGVGEDELYLGTFSRRHPGLSAIGLGESNAGGFPLFDLAASLIAQHLADGARDPEAARRFARRITDHHPDLTGRLTLTDSPRHHGYIDAEAFTRAVRRTITDMGWRRPGSPPARPARPARAPGARGPGARPPGTPGTPGPGARTRPPERPPAFDFAAATIVITGATGGLGSRIAHQAAALGATIVAADLDGDRLAALLAALPRDAGQEHLALAGADLGDEGGAARLAHDVAALPRVDALISNAGMSVGGEFGDRSDAELARELRVNLTAPLQLLRGVLPTLTRSPQPRVVFIGSLGGVIAMGSDPVYAASKFGLRGAALSLALALRKYHVGVSVVQPSAIDTPMLAREAELGAEPSQFITPPQQPDAVAATVLRALRRPRPELYPQRVDGLLARLAMLTPGALPRVSDWASRLGRPGLERYRAARAHDTAPHPAPRQRNSP
ncbi:SDR family NAD(P)-dependent oxidoreductase [Leucobacter luti]|uniref:Short-subunit dehydrogenase n=1 Tax=Leucobacter luti TaxID=340320 RepID=A0A4Q7U5A2_9MICO|nr:SDR family NAD(P)-dependent oxidoreductase [Leucobacter luti]RZT68841.1 short-subunit dehydrogenase [Leucobacter luti]